MHIVVKWSLRVVGGLLGLVIIALLGIYIRAEMIVGATYEAERRDFTLPDDPAAVALGEKVARTRGCLGCHERDGSGGYMVEDRMLAVIASPNLTRLVHERSISDLDRGIRQGIREDGSSVVIMPSGMLQGLSDADFTALIAYLRTLPRVDTEDYRERSFGPIARFAFAFGHFATERQRFADFPEVAPDPLDPVEHGKYLAVTTCTECHGETLHGTSFGESESFRPPDLRIVAAYSLENFSRLMKEGIPQGDETRDLGLMKQVALGRFVHFSDEEIAAMHAYLSSPEFLAGPVSSSE